MVSYALCGTYLATSTEANERNGKLVVVDRNELHLAWLRINNLDETSPYKKTLPRETLQALYNMHMENPQQLSATVAIFEEEYLATKNAELQAQREIKEAKRKAAQNNPKVQRKTKSKKSRPSPVAKYITGTKLAAFFTNVKLYKHLSDREVAAAEAQWAKENANDKKKLRKGWKKDGATFNGAIYSTHVTDSNARMYRCIFETPSREPLDLDEKHTKTLMDHYLDLQESGSESDGLSTASENDGGSEYV
jgi:hypothetical protein